MKKIGNLEFGVHVVAFASYITFSYISFTIGNYFMLGIGLMFLMYQIATFITIDRANLPSQAKPVG